MSLHYSWVIPCLATLLVTNANSASAGKGLVMEVSTNQKTFTVSLPANASTGFQWSVVHFDKELLSLSSSQYIAPYTKLIGAGGKMQYIFTVKKGKKYPAQSTILFKYARSWEPHSGVLKKVTIRFGSS